MDDALQEVAIKAARALPELRDDAALAAWLRRTTYRTCLDLLRREVRLEVRAPEDMPQGRVAGGDPADASPTRLGHAAPGDPPTGAASGGRAGRPGRPRLRSDGELLGVPRARRLPPRDRPRKAPPEAGAGARAGGIAWTRSATPRLAVSSQVAPWPSTKPATGTRFARWWRPSSRRSSHTRFPSAPPAPYPAYGLARPRSAAAVVAFAVLPALRGTDAATAADMLASMSRASIKSRDRPAARREGLRGSLVMPRLRRPRFLPGVDRCPRREARHRTITDLVLSTNGDFRRPSHGGPQGPDSYPGETLPAPDSTATTRAATSCASTRASWATASWCGGRPGPLTPTTPR